MREEADAGALSPPRGLSAFSATCYRPTWSSFTRGCSPCIAMEDSTCFFVSGNVASLTKTVSAMMDHPYEYGTPMASNPPSMAWCSKGWEGMDRI